MKFKIIIKINFYHTQERNASFRTNIAFGDTILWLRKEIMSEIKEEELQYKI